HLCSPTTHTAAAIYAAQEIVEITPASTATSITELAKLRHWTTLFRTVNRDDDRGRFTAQLFAKKYAGRPVAFLHASDVYSVTLAPQFRAELQKHNMTLALDRSFGAQSPNLGGLVAALQEVQAEAVFAIGAGRSIGALARTMRSAGLTAALYGTDQISQPD